MSGNPYAHYDSQGVPGGVAGAAGTSAYPDSGRPTPASGAGRGGAMEYLSKWGKQAESVAGSFWGHMRTSNSLPDAAIGRITHGTRLLREGGFEGVYKQTFGQFQPNEHLKKTYACHLSTSNGAVGGTLYITNLKFAFCSDRELTYHPTPGQQQSSYYKVIVPLEKVREVNPVSNQKKPTDKYIQVVTKDGHEFWYMGFVNYDKGIKNMQEGVRLAQSQGNLSGGAMPGGAAPYGPVAPATYPPAPTDRPGYGPAAPPPPGYPPAGYPPAAKPGYPPA
jgi:hypothetical protein